MKQYKNDNANLENKRGFLLEIGLVVALLIMWGVFDWSSTVERADDLLPSPDRKTLSFRLRRPRSRLSPTSLMWSMTRRWSVKTS